MILTHPCPLITLSLLRFDREPHIYPGAHPLPILYRYTQQPAVSLSARPVKRHHRPDNSQKAHPRNHSGNCIRRQHADTIDEG